MFVERQRDWILRTRERLSKKAESSAFLPQNSDIPSDNVAMDKYVERLRLEARTILPGRLAELSRYASEKTGMDFSFNRVTIKHNCSNWGSCSRKRNINLNLNLMRPTVTPVLRDYVLLHELCHLQVPNHGPRFHALLEQVCPGHRALSRQLSCYRLI